jgi:hypothetical protein
VGHRLLVGGGHGVVDQPRRLGPADGQRGQDPAVVVHPPRGRQRQLDGPPGQLVPEPDPPWADTTIPRRSAGSRTEGSSTRVRISQGSTPLGTTASRSRDDRQDAGSDANRACTAWRTDGGTAAPGAARTSVR